MSVELDGIWVHEHVLLFAESGFGRSARLMFDKKDQKRDQDDRKRPLLSGESLVTSLKDILACAPRQNLTWT